VFREIYRIERERERESEEKEAKKKKREREKEHPVNHFLIFIRYSTI